MAKKAAGTYCFILLKNKITLFFFLYKIYIVHSFNLIQYNVHLSTEHQNAELADSQCEMWT